tara:strand:+ start:166 stop:306 length:141 start_codon:yes stop_codon:yes gene_type:complete
MLVGMRRINIRTAMLINFNVTECFIQLLSRSGSVESVFIIFVLKEL